LRQAADLSPAKQALLARWAHTGADNDAGITPGWPGAPLVLSFVQERQLFLELLDPLTAVNNLATCLRIEGPLHIAALERSAHQAIARHEVLRTSYDLSQGRAIPVVSTEPSFALRLVTLERHPEGEKEALRLAQGEAGRPFDLAQAPLFRSTAFRVAPELHLLLMVIHHTIADGWSLGVLLRELFFHYRAHTDGAPAELPPLPIQYRDFAAWQRDERHAPRFERQLAFWKGRLGGELPVLDLPIDHPRGARQTFSGASYHFRVEATVAGGLKELGRQNDATLFMTLMAGYQVLLHRYCRQDDVLVGTPTAGRTRPETEQLIGAFINTLVLRTDLSGDPPFSDLLRRVREVALTAYAHQDLPFERLVAALRPQRDLSRTPIFQTVFNLQNTPLPELEVPGLSTRLLTVDRGAAQFDLTLLVSESGDGLDAEFEYNRDLFDRATIERLAAAFQRLLAGAVLNPEARLSALPLMDEAERRRLLVELNDTAADYPRTLCIHQLIEAQVERTPHAVALVCDDTRLTYRELDHWANRLAAVLRARGVGPEVRVGVYLERSAGLMAAMLAVLKAGGAYVPIDPTLPAERVQSLLRDSGATLVLTEKTLHQPGPVDTLLVDPPVRKVAPPLSDSGVTPENLAYLIYTSGSTGRPKGVLVSHANLVNLLWSLRNVLGLGAGLVWLAVTSVSFDIAALELYLPLVVGGTVVLATRAETLDRRRLHRAITAHQVNVLQAPPAMWRLLLQGEWRGAPELIALCGGDVLTADLVSQLLPRVGKMWNVYGPTETTVWSAAGELRPGQRPITIGRPIANTQLYVLDPRLHPVPVGATGELCIGGDGVTRGYHNLAEITAERFIPAPLELTGQPPGARLFRTGDLARYRPDGTIEVLGRLDEQVKLNGFRIEPGEIESSLCRHPAIREAKVISREGGVGGRHLVAYVVPHNGHDPAPAGLREFLRATLPAYMIPATFVSLPELPLTAAGKVNRFALPAPLPVMAEPGLALPDTPIERLLAETYAQVLGVPRFGVNDNFFDLGGGSIQILEIIVQLQAEGLTLSPQFFFEHQTVAEMAAALAAAARAATDA